MFEIYLQFYYFCIILQDTFGAVPSSYICHKSTTEGNMLVKLCQKTWATMKRAVSQRKLLKSINTLKPRKRLWNLLGKTTTVSIIAVVTGNSPPGNNQKIASRPVKNNQLNVNASKPDAAALFLSGIKKVS